MRRVVIAIAVAALVGLALFLSLPRNHYIVRALIHQTADIDDYRIFYNQPVEAGAGAPWALHPAFNAYTLTPAQQEFLYRYGTVALLVARDSLLLFEAYWDGYGPASHSNSFSVAKSIVSLLVGCAVADGYIDSLDQPLADFIPEFRDPERGAITIRHLLDMSSGLSWDEAYASLFSTTTQAYYGNFLRELVVAQHVVSEPGREFNYLSGDTQLLALALSAATGRSLSQYASERLWQPIGAEHTALWSLDRAGGVEKAYCCFNSNARDFARLGRLMLNGGQWDGQQVVPAEFIALSMGPASHLTDPELGGITNTRYGFQWWFLNHRGYHVTYARGILGQYIFIIPELQLVAVRLGHERSSERVDGHPTDVFQLLDLAMAVNAAQ